MSKPKKESILGFVDRCLGDARTGKLYLSKRDQARLRKKFASIGVDVKRPFKNEEALLLSYFETIKDPEFFLIYEHFRLYVPGHEDPLENLEYWTDMGLREYLVTRIIVKLNYLNVDVDDITDWVREHVGARYINPIGRIAFEDEERMLELDHMLEARIAAAPRPVVPDTKE